MKFKISLALFTMLFIKSFSQTGIINYSVEPKEISESKTKVKINSELALMEFQLKYHKEYSHFFKQKNIPKNELNSKIASTLVGAYYDYFQNLEEREAYHNQKINNKEYILDYSYKMRDWQLTNENTIINDYQCYKAILKEYNNRTEKYFNTTAWYTPEIPVGYGPIGYGGLPGLIIQLEYKSFIYNVEDIILNPKNIQVKQIEERKKITPKEAVILMRKARKVTED